MAKKEAKSKNVFSDNFTRVENFDKAVKWLEYLAVQFGMSNHISDYYNKEFNNGILTTPIGKVKIPYRTNCKINIQGECDK